jgi:hypothetical protein
MMNKKQKELLTFARIAEDQHNTTGAIPLIERRGKDVDALVGQGLLKRERFILDPTSRFPVAIDGLRITESGRQVI